ncbi:MAG: Dabb family protein [Paludibacteraceae bacterium]|nr:Dabb family protein [Paludibacteraceae bacterium]
MVRHIILWKLKTELSDAQRQEVKKEIKAGLEGLKGKVPGIVDIQVHINGLETSNADVMLESSFTDYAALKAYSVNPLHVEVANTKVRPFTEVRMCLDF